MMGTELAYLSITEPRAQSSCLAKFNAVQNYKSKVYCDSGSDLYSNVSDDIRK